MTDTGQKSAGFTLVEVLIAAVIMFTVLTTSALAFKSARQNSTHAENIISLLAPLPFITDTIKQQIRQNPLAELHGDGRFDEVEFYWSATSVMFLPPPEQLIVENMQLVTYQPRFRLYEVTLNISRNNSSREYYFKELAWLPQAAPE